MSPEDHPRTSDPQLAPHDERRRSQRVGLRVAVRLQAAEKPIEAFTVNVNDHGALIVCAQSFATNDRFTLEHKHTRNRVECRVTRKPQEVPTGFQVAVEFDQPAPGFWHIAFPPTDWKPTD
ncbi:MAG TPA: PilZ domain-containing protein [Candidatus Acidoferrales bacterium]|nr:PilZ domain-containing protein [Candidatus Acidoferrales bacterium]